MDGAIIKPLDLGWAAGLPNCFTQILDKQWPATTKVEVEIGAHGHGLFFLLPIMWRFITVPSR